MKIEIGKEYRIINSCAGNGGVIVTVTGFAGEVIPGIGRGYGPRWYVDRLLPTKKGRYINHLGEQQLEPIYDGNEQSSWESLEGIFTPNSINIKQKGCARL